MLPDPVVMDLAYRLISTALTVAGAISFSAPSLAADWPRFLGPDQNSISSETNLNLDWPAEGPPLLWRYGTGASYSTPVVASGFALVFHRRGDEEVLDVLDADTGEVAWSYRYPSHYVDRYGFNGGPRSSAAVADSFVYTYGAEGVLTCLKLKTGERVWQRPVNAELEIPQNFFGVGMAPVIEKNLILLNVGASGNRGIAAFDRESGKTVWTATGDEAGYSTPVVTTLAGRRQALFLTRAGFVSVNPQTGEVLHEFPFRARVHESVNAASPVVAGDTVLLSSSYGVGSVALRVTADSLETLWRRTDNLQSHWATPIHQAGYIYGVHGRHESEAEIRCIELKTGDIRWKSPRGLGRASMIMVDGHFLILGERGILALARVSPDGYIQLKRVRVLSYPAWSPPVLANGILYLRDETQVIALDLRAEST
jgi:outer membrane protein assembly factor BamB